MISSMDMECVGKIMEKDMKDTGKEGKNMGKASTGGRMVIFTKV